MHLNMTSERRLCLGLGNVNVVGSELAVSSSRLHHWQTGSHSAIKLDSTAV